MFHFMEKNFSYMIKNILIIGSGSIAQNHLKNLKKINKNFNYFLISSRKFNTLIKKDFRKIINFNPNYILICSPSSYHYQHLDFIEKNFIKKIILIEKPIFSKFHKFSKKLKNKYFIGYNLRFHPVLKFLKKYLQNKKCYLVRVNCSSYLPHWRKKNYTKSVSAQKKLGGGVLLELSHELDYLLWVFRKIKITNVLNKKISNLKIDTDDVLILNCITSKKTIINLTINFFSRIPSREIFIDGQNFSIHANFLNNTIKINEQKKKKIIKFKKFSISETYKLENLSIINNKKSNICTFKEGLKLMNFIKEIRNHD